MIRVHVMAVCVVLVGTQAQAQIVLPFLPTVPVVQTEVWRPVKFHGVVSYQLGGRYHFVSDGQHWQTTETVSAQSANSFVEPFDCWGRRIPKGVLPLAGTEWTFQHGVKTYSVIGGETYFPTWVSNGSEICQVWVKIEQPSPVQQSEPTPTPATEPLPTYSPEVVLPPAPVESKEVPIRQKAPMPELILPLPTLPGVK